MKFKDIPQFITKGNWECNFSLPYLIQQFNNWITDDKLQLDPDFQRGHVWSELQSIAFVEALLKGGAKNARVLYLNNPSWCIDNETGYNDFVCVDGLQRYKAVEQFIDNKLKVFGCYYDEFEDDIRMKHDMRVNINDLQTKNEVLWWYIEMNEGGTPHSKEEINKIKNMLREINGEQK